MFYTLQINLNFPRLGGYQVPGTFLHTNRNTQGWKANMEMESMGSKYIVVVV